MLRSKVNADYAVTLAAHIVRIFQQLQAAAASSDGSN
jgi:hypothetical protein